MTSTPSRASYSRSRPTREVSSAASGWPIIVAESMEEVRTPLLASLELGVAGSLQEGRRRVRRLLALPEVDARAPDWLRPEQQPSLRRVVAALRRYGGCLLADPVGSGKTYVALATAGLEASASTTCVVPASLLEEWRRAAASVGVKVALWSHERLSLGTAPAGNPRLVIVDESHRFRNPATRRYATLARWLVGRQVLLVSATPVVNRLGDLASQLLLAVRDDALRLEGLA